MSTIEEAAEHIQKLLERHHDYEDMMWQAQRQSTQVVRPSEMYPKTYQHEPPFRSTVEVLTERLDYVEGLLKHIAECDPDFDAHVIAYKAKKRLEVK